MTTLLRKAAPDLDSPETRMYWRHVLGGRWQHASAEQFGAHPHVAAAVHLLQQFWRANATARGDLDVFNDSLKRLAAGMAAQMKTAGRARLGQVSDALTDQARTAIGRPPLSWSGNLALPNDLATEIAEAQAGQLVANISAESRQTINRLVTQATMEGWSPYQLASMLQRYLPLAPRMQVAVGRMEAAQRNAKVPNSRVRTNAQVYAAKLGRQRAETIARTEMLSAANKALNEGWRRKVTAGHFPHDTQRMWIITRDCKTCPQCRQMVGRRALAQLGEPFDTPVGPIHQPPMHPACRCTLGVVSPGLLLPGELDDLLAPKIPKAKAKRR